MFVEASQREGRETDRQTDRQAGRQAGRQTEAKTGTGRQAEKGPF